MAYSVPIQFEDRAVASVDPETGELAHNPEWLESDNSFPISLSMPLAEGPFNAVGGDVAGALRIGEREPPSSAICRISASRI